MIHVYYYFFHHRLQKTIEYSNALILFNVFLCASIGLFFFSRRAYRDIWRICSKDRDMTFLRYHPTPCAFRNPIVSLFFRRIWTLSMQTGRNISTCSSVRRITSSTWTSTTRSERDALMVTVALGAKMCAMCSGVWRDVFIIYLLPCAVPEGGQRHPGLAEAPGYGTQPEVQPWL